MYDFKNKNSTLSDKKKKKKQSVGLWLVTAIFFIFTQRFLLTQSYLLLVAQYDYSLVSPL